MVKSTTKAVRNKLVAVRLSGDELRMAEALAAKDGVSVSDVIRMSLRRQHEARFPTRRERMTT